MKGLNVFVRDHEAIFLATIGRLSKKGIKISFGIVMGEVQFRRQ